MARADEDRALHALLDIVSLGKKQPGQPSSWRDYLSGQGVDDIGRCMVWLREEGVLTSVSPGLLGVSHRRVREVVEERELLLDGGFSDPT